jgi:hypothetical protein
MHVQPSVLQNIYPIESIFHIDEMYINSLIENKDAPIKTKQLVLLMEHDKTW